MSSNFSCIDSVLGIPSIKFLVLPSFTASLILDADIPAAPSASGGQYLTFSGSELLKSPTGWIAYHIQIFVNRLKVPQAGLRIIIEF